MLKSTRERVEPLLDGLVDLVSIAESLPPPNTASQLSRFERLARDNPRKLPYLLIGAVFAAIMLFSAILIGILLWIATR